MPELYRRFREPPDHSRELSEHFRGPPDRSRELSEHFRELSDPFRELPHPFREFPEHSRELPHHFGELPEMIRGLCRHFRELPEASVELWHLPAEWGWQMPQLGKQLSELSEEDNVCYQKLEKLAENVHRVVGVLPVLVSAIYKL